MKYLNSEGSMILMDDGRIVPATVGNADYDRIIEGGETISPFEPPAPTADNVRAEAQRRIVAETGVADIQASTIRQLNALMRVGELNDKRLSGETLSPEEEAEAAGLRALAGRIKAIRAASNAMEANPPLDYKDDSNWPA